MTYTMNPLIKAIPQQDVLTGGFMKLFFLTASVLLLIIKGHSQSKYITYDGYQGAGKGKHLVLIAADEEYRSEEVLPMLGKILAYHHGYKVSVLFAMHPDSVIINPDYLNNIPGLELLESADLMVLFIRFRLLPDSQMKKIIDYTNSGKPIIGIRDATHAFKYPDSSQSIYKKYTQYGTPDFPGGYGRQVLGETWVKHHGKSYVQSQLH